MCLGVFDRELLLPKCQAGLHVRHPLLLRVCIMCVCVCVCVCLSVCVCEYTYVYRQYARIQIHIHTHTHTHTHNSTCKTDGTCSRVSRASIMFSSCATGRRSARGISRICRVPCLSPTASSCRLVSPQNSVRVLQPTHTHTKRNLQTGVVSPQTLAGQDEPLNKE